jgi:hypothetical protein
VCVRGRSVVSFSCLLQYSASKEEHFFFHILINFKFSISKFQFQSQPLLHLIRGQYSETICNTQYTRRWLWMADALCVNNDKKWVKCEDMAVTSEHLNNYDSCINKTEYLISATGCLHIILYHSLLHFHVQYIILLKLFLECLKLIVCFLTLHFLYLFFFIIYLFVFIYSLFNDAFSNSDCMASNGRMISE